MRHLPWRGFHDVSPLGRRVRVEHVPDVGVVAKPRERQLPASRECERGALVEHLRSDERRKRSPAPWSTIESKVAKADVPALERYLVHQLAHHYKTTELTAIVDFLRSPAGAALNTAADPKSEHAIKQKQAID